MNEQKRNSDNYFNPTPNKKQESTDELVALITMFVSRNKLSPKDLIILNKIIKQLNAQHDNLPNKVIRSMRNKFENIKDKYQR